MTCSSSDVFDMPFEQQDAVLIAKLVRFQLVKIEPRQQPPVHAEFQVRHDRPQVRFHFGAADRSGFVRFERQRERSDAHGLAGGEFDLLSAHDFRVADDTTVDADVFKLQLPVVTPNDGLSFGDQRALQNQHVGAIASDADLLFFRFELLTATVVNSVVPDFHRVALSVSRQ